MKRNLAIQSECSCNFCGKLEKDAEVLVTNHNFYICDECIVKCTNIIAERRIANLCKMTLTEVEGLDQRLFTTAQKQVVANRLAKLRNPFG